jgi:hypothetical protein
VISAANKEGRDDARGGHAHRAFRLRLEMVEPQRRADEEHVEADADLRTDIEDVARFLRKQRGLEFGKEQPEERRPEQHAGDHLAHHLRLPEKCLRCPADGAADEQDHRDLQEEMDAEIGRRIALRRGDRRAVRAEHVADGTHQFIEHI